MTIGAITRSAGESVQTDEALFFDWISFAGDDAYPTGGSAAFDAALQAVVGDARDIIAVIPQDCGGFVPVYDKGTGGAGLLKVFQGDYSNASDGPLVEVPDTTDLSGTTFNLMVISK